eukprot:gene30177-15940_t
MVGLGAEASAGVARERQAATAQKARRYGEVAHRKEFADYKHWLSQPDTKRDWTQEGLWQLWRGDGHRRFPTLGDSAAIVLACPGTACDVERAVSAVNSIKGDGRACMSEFTLIGRLRLKSNGSSFDIAKCTAVP